ncbi:hypothetical protein VTN77DRAFT_3836 [Rasamsonia byssochlamydoides]|uniref:uncharacterized protein n=1 Tax=Rasamsonia byssochlamydoides TaxID=89139 RepID=UPI003742294C
MTRVRLLKMDYAEDRDCMQGSSEDCSYRPCLLGIRRRLGKRFFLDVLEPGRHGRGGRHGGKQHATTKGSRSVPRVGEGGTASRQGRNRGLRCASDKVMERVGSVGWTTAAGGAVRTWTDNDRQAAVADDAERTVSALSMAGEDGECGARELYGVCSVEVFFVWDG